MALRSSILPFVLLCCLLPSVLFGWFVWHDAAHSLFAGRQLVVRDYLNLWAGGRLAADGQVATVFQPERYAAWLRASFGEQLDLYTWSYPPHLLLLAVPLAGLGLLGGYFVWIAATTALLWGVLRRAGFGAGAAAAVAFSPAALENMLEGQNGALVAGAALGGGLLLAGTRPVAAGLLLGLLTLKPQLGLLVPVCLVARREHRALLCTAGAGAAYCLLDALAFGEQPWRDYLHNTVPFMAWVLRAPLGIASHDLMVPPFISARAVGLDVPAAFVVQAIASLLCIGLAAWAWRAPGADRRAAVALALFLTPLATPYSHAYDLVGVAIGCALLVRQMSETDGPNLAGWLCLAPAWIWPGAALLLGLLVSPGLGTPALLPGVALALCHLRRSPKALLHGNGVMLGSSSRQC